MAQRALSQLRRGPAPDPRRAHRAFLEHRQACEAAEQRVGQLQGRMDRLRSEVDAQHHQACRRAAKGRIDALLRSQPVDGALRLGAACAQGLWQPLTPLLPLLLLRREQGPPACLPAAVK